MGIVLGTIFVVLAKFGVHDNLNNCFGDLNIGSYEVIYGCRDSPPPQLRTIGTFGPKKPAL